MLQLTALFIWPVSDFLLSTPYLPSLSHQPLHLHSASVAPSPPIHADLEVTT